MFREFQGHPQMGPHDAEKASWEVVRLIIVKIPVPCVSDNY